MTRLEHHPIVALWALCDRQDRPQFLGAWPDVRDMLPEQTDEWMRDAVRTFLDYCEDGDPIYFAELAGRWRFVMSVDTLTAPVLELDDLRDRLDVAS